MTAAVMAVFAMAAGLTLCLSGCRSSAGAAGDYANIGNAGEIVPLSHHQLLITDVGNLDRTGGQVIITNFSGQLLWRYTGTLDIPHSAYPAKRGRILIADAGDNRVIEVNRHSHIVWDSDDLGSGHGQLGMGTLSDGTHIAYPNDAKPLKNGDIQISCRLQSRVITITPTGTIVRDIHGFLHRQHNPDLLPNGHTLIADSGADRVVEVNGRGHIVWSFGGQDSNGDDVLAWPRDANLLPNGDILITDSDNNRLIEVTRSKQIIRQWTNLDRPYSSASLPDGNILVGDGGYYGVVELNQQDKIVWSLNHHPSGGSGGSTPPKKYKVLNSGFEQSLPGHRHLLSQWKREDALAYSTAPGKRVAMTRDCHVAHSGRCSGRVTYHGDSNGIYFGQAVPVHGGAQYRFSGWIRTRNVKPCYPCSYGNGLSGRTAEYELTFNVPSGPQPPTPIIPLHSGTTGWKHDSVTFTLPSNVRSVSIHCELRGQGTVWFDDVKLKESGS